jgi:hypothetical protein
MSRPDLLFALAILCLVASVATRTLIVRSQRARRAFRTTYMARYLPIVWRNAVSLLPAWAAVVVVFALTPSLPRSGALWIVVVTLAIGLVSFVLAYRVPAPFLPPWLRDEIAQGVTPVARPDRGDWVVFWFVVPLTLVGLFAGLVLILAYGVGSS